MARTIDVILATCLGVAGLSVAAAIGVSVYENVSVARVRTTSPVVSSVSPDVETSIIETIPIIPEPKKIHLLFVGDMMFDRTVRTRMNQAGSLHYPFQKIEQKGLFQTYDLVIGNLEGPLTAVRRAPEKSIDFAFDPAMADVIRDVGFDVVSQANNHALDQGRVGAVESRRFAEQAGLVVFGDQVHDDMQASLAIVPFDSTTLAFIGFNITDNPLDLEAASTTLAYAEHAASSTIIFMHWGNEYHATPDRTQIELAHWLIDHGADAVIGAHPHWVQSIESYRGQFIVYSLGNFIFDQDWSTETNEGLAVGLSLREGKWSMDLHPIQIIKSQPHVVEGAERQTRLDDLARISDPCLTDGIREGIVQLCADTFK